ncbi:MAG: hypothetical protein JXD21_01210 [Candidatus Omnitrophica bacterium]|nr:hypothetical protein [Candidatus Omnitrophota bacterium]
MNPIVYVNGIFGVVGMLFLWRGDIFIGVTAVIFASAAFIRGCHEIIHIDTMKNFADKPDYYTDFVVNFDLFFPVAMIALLVAKGMR